MALVRPQLGRDLLASVVVFLVALPLCMGIAIASGVPPALGLVTGIVGGLVVGFLAGSPLQVSGPAAGLAVLVWQMVERFGLAALGPIVLLGGAIQLLAGTLKLGQWFRAVAPAVIQGMLAGIGVLIFAAQFHVMVDDKPRGSGIANLLSIPEAVWKGVLPPDGTSHHLAALVGLLTIGTIIGWNLLKPRRLAFVPAPLVGVVAGSLVAGIFALPIHYVNVPASIVEAVNVPSFSTFATSLVNPDILLAALALAFIASAETLLCATAVDRMHDGPRTDYNKELRAQGVGNLLCGALGALPMTGVIVRSSANVEAGAKTRASAILHGALLLVFVAAFPMVLARIPVAALAAVLVFTGYKLLNVAAIKALKKAGWSELGIYAATLVGIVVTDLLTGVLLGFALSVARLVLTFARLNVRKTFEGPGRVHVELSGAATFVSLPKLAEALESLPPGTHVVVDVEHVAHIDHACFELLAAWEKQTRARGGSLELDWNGLRDRARGPVFPAPVAAPAERAAE